MKTSLRKSSTLRNLALSLFVAALLGAPSLAYAATTTMDQIKQTKELRIGVAPGDPWYFKDPISGQWSGVGVMIGQVIAKDLGAKLVPVETTWGSAVAGLQANQIDVMFVLDPTVERKKALDFPASPLLWEKQAVLVRPGLDVKNWPDLNKSSIKLGTTLGTATDRFITAKLPDTHIERFANTDEAVAAFMAGRIDGIAFYHPALVIVYSHIRRGKVVVPEPAEEIATSAGVRKESDPAFKQFLDKEFEKYYKDGTIQNIYAQYLKTKGIDPTTVPSVTQSTK
jgi:polar amino acid transport system substrate-binding protein